MKTSKYTIYSFIYTIVVYMVIANILKAETQMPSSSDSSNDMNMDMSKKEQLHKITKDLNDPTSDVTYVRIKDTLSTRTNNKERYTKNLITFDSVIPFVITKDWKILTRLTFEYAKSIEDGYSGVSNSHNKQTGFLDPKAFSIVTHNLGHFVVGLGLAATMPWASVNYMKTNDWKVGPAGMFFYKKNNFIGGFVAQDYISTNNKYDNNLLNIQYLANYTFGSWNIKTSPTISYNVRTNDLTFPVGAGISTTVFIGKFPLMLGVEYDYNIESNPEDNGKRNNMIMFNFMPMLPLSSNAHMDM